MLIFSLRRWFLLFYPWNPNSLRYLLLPSILFYFTLVCFYLCIIFISRYREREQRARERKWERLRETLRNREGVSIKGRESDFNVYPSMGPLSVKFFISICGLNVLDIWRFLDCVTIKVHLYFFWFIFLQFCDFMIINLHFMMFAWSICWMLGINWVTACSVLWYLLHMSRSKGFLSFCVCFWVYLCQGSLKTHCLSSVKFFKTESLKVYCSWLRFFEDRRYTRVLGVLHFIFLLNKFIPSCKWYIHIGGWICSLFLFCFVFFCFDTVLLRLVCCGTRVSSGWP